MNRQKDILTLQETEQLCRLFMECGLSALEEMELRYVLDRLPYTSPVIEEARKTMAAEKYLLPKDIKAVPGKKKRFPFRWIAWAAASIAVLLAFPIGSIMTEKNVCADNEYDCISGTNEIIIAYEAGKRLDPESSVKAVDRSLRRAEALMAMANAKEKENEMLQQNIIKLTSAIE